MTEKDFAALLGNLNRSDEDVTIESAIELMQSALFRLMPDSRESDLDICGTTVVAWSDTAMLLRDSEGGLWRIAPNDENDLKIDQDGYEAYYLLVDEGALDKVLNPVAVAELQRLHDEYVAENTTKKRDAELAELKRLKTKYEGTSDD